MVSVAKSRVILKYSGYIALTFLMTLYFSFLTFPFDTLKDRLIPQISRTVPFSLDVGEINATPLFGIKASNIVLYSSEGTEKQKSNRPIMTIQKMKIRPSILSLLFGKQAVHIHGWLYGGEIQGKIGKKGPSMDLALEWKAISFRKYEHAPEGMKVDGTFSGDIDLRVPNRNPAQSEGSIEFHISEGSIKDHLEIYSFSIPELNAITGTGRIKVGNKKATLEELSLGSNEINLSLTGDMDLAPYLSQSRMNLKGSLRLSGKFAAQYEPLLEGLLRTKNKDGSYPFSIRGTPIQPRFGA